MEPGKLKRVLLLTQFFHPEPARLKGLPVAAALKAEGCEVQVLTCYPNYPKGRIYPGYRTRLWQKEFVEGVEVIRLPIFPSHDASGFRRAVTYLSFMCSALILGPFLVRRPSAIHVYNLPTLNFVARLLRLLYGSKIVLDIQDLWPESVSSSGMLTRGWLTKILKCLSDNEYRRADRLVALSPGMKRILVKRGIPADKITVVYNWNFVSNNNHLGPSDIANSIMNWKGPRFLVAYAGNVGKMQALTVMIDAARSLRDSHPDVCFLIVGDGTETSLLSKLSDGLPNLKLMPSIARESMPSIFLICDALLVHLKRNPIFEVTIPSKLQSYMHAGRPILIGLEGDAADLVEEAKCGISFTPESSTELCEAIIKLKSKTPAELSRMGTNGQSYYEQNLSFSKGFAKLKAALLD
jgi:colanic acid biosynthesis glycosyl transferase WcaI